jgi:hypothetical protein
MNKFGIILIVIAFFVSWSHGIQVRSAKYEENKEAMLKSAGRLGLPFVLLFLFFAFWLGHLAST